MTPKVAVDLDGVLFDFIGGIQFRLRDRWGIDMPRSDIVGNVSRLTGNPMVDQDLHQQIFNPKFYYGLSVFPDVADRIRSLADHANIYAITSRPPSTRKVTMLRLSSDFPAIIDLHYTSRKHRTAKALGIRYAVEDHAPTAESYSKNRIRTWLVRSGEAPALKRNRLLKVVGSTPEALEEIESRCRMRTTSI
jgi:5'(3')-deoxyribonucleotidase